MFGWKEVWMGSDSTAFFCRQNALRDNGILFKTKTVSNSTRFMGGGTFTTRGGETAGLYTYYLYVKAPDEQRAHALFLALRNHD